MSDYSSINYLQEITFIGGNEFLFNFEVFDENGAPQDINASTPSIKISPYGNQGITILSKNGVITGLNTFTVTLTSNETRTLYGKYSYQPMVVSFDGTEYRPGQGVLTITRRIT